MKADLVREYFSQIESQVQFGDQKASFLLTGNSILLAFSGALIKAVTACTLQNASAACFTLELILALAAALLLLLSLALALWAIRPARVHSNPRSEFFLLSYVADMEQPAFVEWYQDQSYDDLEKEALKAIHGKADLARTKFRWLGRAVDATLASLVCMAGALVLALA